MIAEGDCIFHELIIHKLQISYQSHTSVQFLLKTQLEDYMPDTWASNQGIMVLMHVFPSKLGAIINNIYG